MKDITIFPQPITSSTEIRHQIMRLNALKEEQEMAIRRDLKELYYSMQLSTIIRRAVKDLGDDEEVKSSTLHSVIGIGSSFLLDKVLFRKGAGIKSYLLNLGLKKLISYFTSGNKLTELLSKKQSFT